ncbi:hypothetical protein [Streptomyces lonarensis]|uniref:Uncharacterized protein n=1 Tax=Streptomyces lonarensis TaxID=700599 RepID=A0A7X6CZX2_9ACTN|nr:hypothetical protein [Streptomyces lonarensis]NJQ05545.1 hypothetical protein [Streptomyces lonarensis]
MAQAAPSAAPVKDRPLEYGQANGRRHPLVALAMVLPFALALAVLFGGVEAVVTQVSSVAGAIGW